MYETLTRTHDPTPIVAPDIGTAVRRIEEVEDKKGRRREGQIKEAARRREEKLKLKEAEEAAAASMSAETSGTNNVEPAKTDADTAAEGETLEPAPKRVKLDAGVAETSTDQSVDPAPPTTAASEPTAEALAEKAAQGRRLREERDRERAFGTKAGAYTRGHTSFLTFAVLLPHVEGLKKPASLLPSAAVEAAANGVEEQS